MERYSSVQQIHFKHQRQSIKRLLCGRSVSTDLFRSLLGLLGLSLLFGGLGGGSLAGPPTLVFTGHDGLSPAGQERRPETTLPQVPTQPRQPLNHRWTAPPRVHPFGCLRRRVPRRKTAGQPIQMSFRHCRSPKLGRVR